MFVERVPITWAAGWCQAALIQAWEVDSILDSIHMSCSFWTGFERSGGELPATGFRVTIFIWLVQVSFWSMVTSGC